ncbi:MAG: ISAs1 family transposase [Oligoflexia bacterium]|nr:ISAs1 family transposase [Oligoflexia bacterium]
MQEKDSISLIEHLSIIKDPRIERTKKHKLIDILIITVCAVICRNDTWNDIEDFALENEEWFRKFLDLDNGIPSHDTIARVVSLINPKEFERAFYQWTSSIKTILNDEHHIAIDDKSLRGTLKGGDKTSPLNLIHAWSINNNVVLAQNATGTKTNEITIFKKYF